MDVLSVNVADCGPEPERVWLALVKSKCYSIVLSILRLQSEGKEEKMAACWALKEKYWLWSFKISLEAQSGLQFWDIVKKHMQQIRTYCSSEGIIRPFEPWAPLLSSCLLHDKLTSLSYSYVTLVSGCHESVVIRHPCLSLGDFLYK